MVSSSKVNSDSSAIQELFSSYKSNISSLNSSDSWKGKSKTNFIEQAENFVSEFVSSMKSQLSTFASSLDNLEKWKKAKENYERAESNYNSVKNSEDQSSASTYRSEMSKYKQEMDELKKTIKSQISEVASMKVNTTPASEMFIQDFHLNEFVYFKQGDYKQAYGRSGTISSSGCGPTSAAMVLTYLTGETVTPVEAADYSVKHGYRVEGNGTSESLFPAIAQSYGLTCQKQSQTASNIVQSLSDGNVIIAHMGPGTFTSGGHYIVLRDTDGNGNVLVADPANPSRNKWYPASIFQQQAKGSMYSFNVA